MIKVLLVEDEAPIQEMVSFTLSMRDIEVKCVSDVSSALVALADSSLNFSCIIIDWMLPDKSGISLVKRIRSDDSLKKLPIIMLTAKADEKNKLKGFEVGVDDYITKPFSPKELHARILALLNRSDMLKAKDQSNNIINIKELSIDLNNCEVKVKDNIIALGPIEYRLLVYLVQNKNTVCSREKLLQKVWDDKPTLTNRTVDVHIRRVRFALENTEYADYIQTIRSFGYCFKVKS